MYYIIMSVGLLAAASKWCSNPRTAEPGFCCWVVTPLQQYVDRARDHPDRSHISCNLDGNVWTPFQDDIHVAARACTALDHCTARLWLSYKQPKSASALRMRVPCLTAQPCQRQTPQVVDNPAPCKSSRSRSFESRSITSRCIIPQGLTDSGV